MELADQDGSSMISAKRKKHQKKGKNTTTSECRYLDFGGEEWGEGSIELKIRKFHGTSISMPFQLPA